MNYQHLAQNEYCQIARKDERMSTNQQTVRQGFLVKMLKASVKTGIAILCFLFLLFFIPGLLEWTLSPLPDWIGTNIILLGILFEAILSAALILAIPITAKLTGNRRWWFLMLPPAILLVLILVNIPGFFPPF